MKHLVFTICMLLSGIFAFAAEESPQPHDTDIDDLPEMLKGESIDGYQIIISKNLFFPLGSDPGAQKKDVDLNKPILTVVYEDGQKKALFTNSKTGVSSYVSEGENLESGAQVAEVSERSVKLVKDGQEMMRSMDIVYMGSSYRPQRRDRLTDEKMERLEGRQALKAGERAESPPGQKFKVGTPEWREAFKRRKLEELGIYGE